MERADIDETFVRDLVRDQHPDLADLAIRPVPSGWDKLDALAHFLRALHQPAPEGVPGTDLAAAWKLLPQGAASDFLGAYGDHGGHCSPRPRLGCAVSALHHDLRQDVRRVCQTIMRAHKALPDDGPTLPSAIQVVTPFNLPPDVSPTPFTA